MTKKKAKQSKGAEMSKKLSEVMEFYNKELEHHSRNAYGRPFGPTVDDIIEVLKTV